jgi:peptidoglycan-associated lipoprotein
MKIHRMQLIRGEMLMQKLFRAAVILVAGVGLLWSFASTASGQIAERIELGGNYDYMRTNAPPDGCGCFSMNGGSGWFGYKFNRSLSLVGEVGGQHAANIDGTTGSLTLTSFLAGARYALARGDRIVPFGQVLLGGAHASGALTPAPSGLAASANSFAMTAGGGVDITLTRHLALRAVQADYFLTRFNNGANDQQNNFRVGTGIVYRFGKK